MLQLELAAAIDAGEGMVKATYLLERDGPIILQSFELVNSILQSFKTLHYLNVKAVCRQLCQMSTSSSEAEQQLMAYAFSCVNPGIQYLTDTLSSTLKDALEIFKAARLTQSSRDAVFSFIN